MTTTPFTATEYLLAVDHLAEQAILAGLLDERELRRLCEELTRARTWQDGVAAVDKHVVRPIRRRLRAKRYRRAKPSLN